MTQTSNTWWSEYPRWRRTPLRTFLQRHRWLVDSGRSDLSCKCAVGLTSLASQNRAIFSLQPPIGVYESFFFFQSLSQEGTALAVGEWLGNHRPSSRSSNDTTVRYTYIIARGINAWNTKWPTHMFPEQ